MASVESHIFFGCLTSWWLHFPLWEIGWLPFPFFLEYWEASVRWCTNRVQTSTSAGYIISYSEMVIFFREYLQRCFASCYMHESPGSSIPITYGFLSFSLHILGTKPTYDTSVQFSSVQSFSHVRLFATPWTATRQASLSNTNSQSLPKHWVGDAFSSCLQSYPASGSFQMSQNSSYQVAKVLEFQLQHQSYQWTPRTDLLYDGLVGSPRSPRGSQESSPTPWFKSINSLAQLSL